MPVVLDPNPENVLSVEGMRGTQQEKGTSSFWGSDLFCSCRVVTSSAQETHGHPTFRVLTKLQRAIPHLSAFSCSISTHFSNCQGATATSSPIKSQPGRVVGAEGPLSNIFLP